jgi:hypothetical protein
MGSQSRAFLYTFLALLLKGRISVAVCLSRFLRLPLFVTLVWHGWRCLSVSVDTVSESRESLTRGLTGESLWLIVSGSTAPQTMAAIDSMIDSFNQSYNALSEHNQMLADFWLNECWDAESEQWTITEQNLKDIQKDVENNVPG